MWNPRPGLTVLELCVAMLIVAGLSSLAAVQFSSRSRPIQSPDSTRGQIRAARVTALRSGHSVTGAFHERDVWVEYTALPLGVVLIDSVASPGNTGRRTLRGDRNDTR